MTKKRVKVRKHTRRIKGKRVKVKPHRRKVKLKNKRVKFKTRIFLDPDFEKRDSVAFTMGKNPDIINIVNMKNVDPEESENILAHEELHNILQREVDDDGLASSRLDSLTDSAVFGDTGSGNPSEIQFHSEKIKARIKEKKEFRETKEHLRAEFPELVEVLDDDITKLEGQLADLERQRESQFIE